MPTRKLSSKPSQRIDTDSNVMSLYRNLGDQNVSSDQPRDQHPLRRTQVETFHKRCSTFPHERDRSKGMNPQRRSELKT